MHDSLTTLLLKEYCLQMLVLFT